MERTSLRQKIINELLHSTSLSVKPLCELTSTSRVSVSKELSALVDAEIITNAEGSRKYFPSPKMAFVIFKLYFDRAELVTYSLDGTLYTREKMALLYSLAHEDNVAFLLPRIKRHRDALSNNFQKVFTFIIYDTSTSLDRLPRGFFDQADQRANIVARQIKYNTSDEAVLYVNNVSPLSFIAQDGKAITPSTFPTEKALNSPQSAFTFIRPSRVILEGNECAPLTNVCIKQNILLRNMDTHTVLSSDELGIIKEFLFSLSKTK